MALRFQQKDDIDSAAREQRATPITLMMFAVIAAIAGVNAWISGRSLLSYEQELGWLAGCFIVYWFLTPLYYEFRIRTKEIDGKVSAIEGALKESKKSHAELLEKVNAIAKRLERQGEAERD